MEDNGLVNLSDHAPNFSDDLVHSDLLRRVAKQMLDWWVVFL